MLTLFTLSGGVYSFAFAQRWQDQYPVLQFSRISSENEADRISRHKKMLAYLERTLGVKVKMHVATEYAGTIEALRSKKVEFAVLGPASYAAAWEVTGGKVEVILAGTDKFGNLGYHSVIAVKKDSPFQSISDLKGKDFRLCRPQFHFRLPGSFLLPARTGVPARHLFRQDGVLGEP